MLDNGTSIQTAVPQPGEASADFAYPPPPWRLGGQLVASLLLVPEHAIPEAALAYVPLGMRPLAVRGRIVVGVAFAEYTPGSVIEYRELLVVLPIWSSRKLALTIPHIWVDSDRSRLGARSLWAIPKEMALFSGQTTAAGGELMAFRDGRHVASVKFRSRVRLLPGWQVFPITTRQRIDDRTVVARNVIVCRAKAMSASWAFNARGPLSYLHDRSQLGSVVLSDLTVAFGIDTTPL